MYLQIYKMHLYCLVNQYEVPIVGGLFLMKNQLVVSAVFVHHETINVTLQLRIHIILADVKKCLKKNKVYFQLV